MAAEPGRRAFAKAAPKGFRIRMMEPGEAEGLQGLLAGADADEPAGPLAHVRAEPDFVRWLLAHEIFVAETRDGALAGFAAAQDAVDLYWLSALCVAPAHRRRGVGRALAGAVAARAGWFFHRAVGLAAFRNVGLGRTVFERCGYMMVSRNDLPAMLLARVDGGRPPEDGQQERVAMIRWL